MEQGTIAIQKKTSFDSKFDVKNRRNFLFSDIEGGGKIDRRRNQPNHRIT